MRMAVASITAERFPPVDANSVLELAHMLCTARSHDELRDRAMSALRPYGYMGFTFAVVRRVKSVFLHARVFSTWPTPVQVTFEQQKLFESDPVILRSRTAREPFCWDLSIYDERQDAHRTLLALRKDTGVEGGVCLPVFEAFSGRSVLFLTGVGFDTSQRSLLALQLLTEHLANRVNALNLPEIDDAAEANRFFRSGGELSPRERQVFGWIAFGKSSRDIAAIMSISEHTVNDYIANVMTKLRASNRTEAVLRALLTNQIDLA
jgi:LuxR family transcriptional regulator, quorum-sensing system regulator BjaR1